MFLASVGGMSNSQIEFSSDTPALAPDRRSQPWIRMYSENWIAYSATIIGGLMLVILAAVLTDSVWAVGGLAMAALAIGIASQLVQSKQVSDSKLALQVLEDRLSGEASASRILSGIKVLNGGESMSPDARLAAASRMATEYPAAVVFNLRDAHGVLAPSNWSYEGQLSQIREEFEVIDGDLPGASAARQGSAIVMSVSDVDCLSLPTWAEQAGFTQGIVAPISRGLDTIGIVYVLNKSTSLPTLNEIEQLELIISFSSAGSSIRGNSGQGSQQQPFRVVEKSSAAPARNTATAPIRMAGFALNPEFERMEMDGTQISLSPTEFLLMHALASSPEKPVSPVELMDRCWTKESRPADNAVDVAIFRLRKKLNKTASGKGLIKTVRGNGYMFVPPTVDAGVAVVAD